MCDFSYPEISVIGRLLVPTCPDNWHPTVITLDHMLAVQQYRAGVVFISAAAASSEGENTNYDTGNQKLTTGLMACTHSSTCGEVAAY